MGGKGKARGTWCAGWGMTRRKGTRGQGEKGLRQNERGNEIGAINGDLRHYGKYELYLVKFESNNENC